MSGLANAGIVETPVVVFDFDGTLVDTGPAILKCAARSLEVHGYDPSEMHDLNLIIGPPLVDGFRQVADISREEALPLVATYREIFAREVVPSDYPPLPGMPELLHALRAQGRRIAVATSRLESSVTEMLAATSLPTFDAIAGRLEPGRDTKADCIAAVLEELGCAGDQAVMVGDRKYDVEGAHALGLACIGICGDASGRAELEAAGADALAASVDELAALLGIEGVQPKA